MAKNSNNKARRIKGRFLALPHNIINSATYRGLSTAAVKLLVDIGEQYNQRNNGDLCAAYSVMQGKGWKSKHTLQKARDELLVAGLIEQTRQGGMNMGPNLYAITWQPVDECRDKSGRRKLDQSPTSHPSNLWKVREKGAA